MGLCQVVFTCKRGPSSLGFQHLQKFNLVLSFFLLFALFFMLYMTSSCVV